MPAPHGPLRPHGVLASRGGTSISFERLFIVGSSMFECWLKNVAHVLIMTSHTRSCKKKVVLMRLLILRIKFVPGQGVKPENKLPAPTFFLNC